MLTLLLPFVAALALQDTPQDAPPIFQDLNLSDALVRGVELKRLVLVNATAPWCGSCRKMDATTWIDASVVSWAANHGLCIQLDLDQDILSRSRLKVSAYPTLLVFRDGLEIDRVVGARGAADLLAWLNGLGEGATVTGELEARVRATAKTATWEERADRFVDLLDATLDDLATREMQRLWRGRNELPEGTTDGEAGPAARLVRLHGELRGPMRALIKRNPRARTSITSIRSTLKPKSVQTAGSPDFRTWLELSYVLDDERHTINWIRRQEQAGEDLEALDALHERLFDPMMRYGLARVAGRFLRSPMAALKKTAAGLNETVASSGTGASPRGASRSNLFGDQTSSQLTQQQDPHELAVERFRQRSAQIYAALLASDRMREAEPVALHLLETADDPRSRLVLLNWVVDANVMGRARQRHKLWMHDLYDQ